MTNLLVLSRMCSGVPGTWSSPDGRLPPWSWWPGQQCSLRTARKSLHAPTNRSTLLQHYNALSAPPRKSLHPPTNHSTLLQHYNALSAPIANFCMLLQILQLYFNTIMLSLHRPKISACSYKSFNFTSTLCIMLSPHRPKISACSYKSYNFTSTL